MNGLFDAKLKADCSLIEEYLENLSRTAKAAPLAKTVSDAMDYSLLGGGKRIRAVLVLEFCRLCGGKDAQALPFCAAIEMIHAYSLIHDDLPCMDDDDMRRGKPSCHKQFGEWQALLAGDALLNRAFETVLQQDMPAERAVRALRCLSDASGINGMIGGQVIDLESEGQSIEYDRLRTLHRLKTGALIRAAALMGVIAADGREEDIAAATEYSENLGLAFQIVDDILDVTATEEELGKPIGSDEKSGKTTYITLFGIEKAKELAQESTETAMNALKQYGSKAEFLVSLAQVLSQRRK